MREYILKYWLDWCYGAICAVLTGVFAFVGKKYHNMQKKQCATELGVQALLRAQIIHLYNKYIEIGSVPIYERENIDQLYQQYHNLGGNGVIHDLIERLNELPTPK